MLYRHNNKYNYQQSQQNESESKSDLTCDKIIELLLDRKLTALMFHQDLVKLFVFLGLDGYKAMQEYQFYDETKGFRELQDFYMHKYDKIPVIKGEPLVELNLKSLTTRFELEADKKRGWIRFAFEEWLKWEAGTKDLIGKLMHEAEEIGSYSTINELNKSLVDVCDEIKEIKQYLLVLVSTSCDIPSIYQEQEELSEKFKEKLATLFVIGD